MVSGAVRKLHARGATFGAGPRVRVRVRVLRMSSVSYVRQLRQETQVKPFEGCMDRAECAFSGKFRGVSADPAVALRAVREFPLLFQHCCGPTSSQNVFKVIARGPLSVHVEEN